MTEDCVNCLPIDMPVFTYYIMFLLLHITCLYIYIKYINVSHIIFLFSTSYVFYIHTFVFHFKIIHYYTEYFRVVPFLYFAIPQLYLLVQKLMVNLINHSSNSPGLRVGCRDAFK